MAPPEHSPLLHHDEKRPQPPILPAKQRKLRFLHTARKLTLILGFLTTASYLLIGYHTSFTGSLTPHDTPFRWTDITPTPSLIWHPCFSTSSLRCARLSVPMDYTSPSDPRRVAIAIAAYIPPSSQPLSSAILVNPGGPGGSGVAMVRATGPLLSRVSGGFPIIGFDPRGVNNTSPPTSCFPDRLARDMWFVRGAGRGLEEEFARSRSLGAECERVDEDGSVAYVGTGNVARDMVAIVDALGAAGLRYWGFSYGSVLGMTFARLFPSRVDRMVLDGVVDLEDYYAGSWRRNLQDTDKVIAAFYTYCSSSPDRCSFSAPTPCAVEERLNRLLAAPPLPVVPGPDWITPRDIKTAVFWSLYNPLVYFPILADALSALEAGDAAPLAGILHQPVLAPTCAAEEQDREVNTGIEADSAVVCSDAFPGNAKTGLAGFREYVDELRNQSAVVAECWSRIQMACTGWRIPAKGVRLRGGTRTVKTKHPVLFVGNTKDPVTPLRNAKRMRTGFDAAGLLTLDAVGHSSLAARSRCAEAVVGTYFKTGETTEAEVRCDVDAVPFGEAEGAEAEERRVWAPVFPGVIR